MVYEAPTSLFELVERPAYPIAELGSHRLMFSIKVMVIALMRAICTNALGRALMPPFADPHANHSSVPARVAPTSLGSARCSQSCPSGVVELYGPADQLATGTSLAVGEALVSFQEKTRRELVELCAAK